MHLSLAFTINILLFTIFSFKYSYCDSQFDKRNLIIFFTKPDIDENINPIDDSGIQFLKFPVSGMIQANEDIPVEFENIFKINLNSPDCNAIFSTYLLDLISWAVEDKNMITATLSNHETDFSRVIVKNVFTSFQGNYKNFKFTLHLPPNLEIQRKANLANSELLDPYRIHASYLHEFEDMPLATIDTPVKGSPPLRFENQGDFIQDIIAYDAKDVYNDEFGFKRSRAKIEAENKKMYNKHYKISSFPVVAGSEQTRKKTDYIATTTPTPTPTITTTTTTTTATTVNEDANKNVYKFLAAISFFNKLEDVFMDSLLNPYEKRDSNSEENQIDYSVIGKVNENTMLKAVKSTLNTLKIQSRHEVSGINGFLMVVFAGNISEISDPFSDLIQSVKYVLEHTNTQDTLILVTCYCPIRSIENRIEKRRIPYFAGGMDSDDFKNIISMWDMLDKMKISVTKTWKKGKAKVQHIIHPNEHSENKGKIRVNGTSCNSSRITISTPKNTEKKTKHNMKVKGKVKTNERFRRALDSSESSNALLAYNNFGVVFKFVLLFDYSIYCLIND